jgi:hypothetical protein
MLCSHDLTDIVCPVDNFPPSVSSLERIDQTCAGHGPHHSDDSVPGCTIQNTRVPPGSSDSRIAKAGLKKVETKWFL